MLQWMGGSRRKVTSSRNSIHNRQKKYFEQRKRQQQVSGLENLSGAQKQVHYQEKPRSLDILSLKNLATDAQQGYSSKSDGSHGSHLSPENMLTKVISRYPEDTKKSGSKPRPLTMTKNATENGLQDMPSFHGSCNEIDKKKVESLPCEYPSNNIKKPCKQEDHVQNKVSVFDLLGDDGPNNISHGDPIPEAHVAFSVEGLGKVGIGTPAHSPRRYARNLPSPPRAQRRTRSLSKPECSRYNLGIKTNALMQDIMEEQDDSPLDFLCDRRDIFDDDFSPEKSPALMFTCTSPDAYENQSQKFNYEEESQPWNSAVGIFEENLLNVKSDAEVNKKPSHRQCYPSFTSKSKKLNSSDYDFRETFSPSRNFLTEDTRSNVSALSAQYFSPITSVKECDPRIFGRDSPYSTFSPPDWSFWAMDDSQDSTSFLSEESFSSAAVRDDRSYDVGSNLVKFKKSKSKHKDQNRKDSRKKFDLGEFSADQLDPAELEEFVHEQNIARAGNYKNMTNQRKFKASHSSNNYACQDTRTFSQDDFFDSFPMPELFPSTNLSCGKSKSNDPNKNESSINFNYESEILKQFSAPDAPLPAAFPWETEDYSLHSSFDIDFDTQFPGTSKKKNVCEAREDENRRIPENPQKQDSAEKNSLSSNGRTAGVADGNKNCSENAELKNQSPELFYAPVDTNEECPRSTEEVPSQLENCVDDNLNHFDSHEPVPSQVVTKDKNPEPANKNIGGDASYRVMLERYVLQLICVQKVLLEASQKDIKKVG